MRINIKTTLIEIEIEDGKDFSSDYTLSIQAAATEAIRLHNEVAKDLYENEKE